LTAISLCGTIHVTPATTASLQLAGAGKCAALNEEDVMAMLAMAVPIPAGKTEQWKKFVSELNGARKAEYVASRRTLGVRERTFLQQTPQGDLVLLTIEGDHPETAFAEFGKRTDPFTMWFKQQVMEIHGMDLSAPPPGPMPHQVIDSKVERIDAQRISDPALIDAVFRLRAVAWATEGVSFPDSPDGRVFDPADATGEHYGIIEDGDVVAAIRLTYHAGADSLPMAHGSWHTTVDYPVALLSRLVVRPDSRRRGYGSLLAAHAATQAMGSAARTHVAYVYGARCILGALSECGFSSIGNTIIPWGNRALDATIWVRSGVSKNVA